jgi:CSLREA domain-containing protein
MRSNTRLSYALAVTLLLGLSLFSTRNASAANFTVNSLLDTPDASLTDGVCADSSAMCTLRAAIQQANANTLDDAIGFSVTGTINLTGELPDLLTNMTINGPGSSRLAVRRNSGGDYRIFTTYGLNVAISGLTITNGKAPDGPFTGFTKHPGLPGGGIFVGRSVTLTLTGCVISGNSSGAPGDGLSGGPPPDSSPGGGIYNEGRLTMNNCTVSDNRVPERGPKGDGGGIYSSGDLNMTNCIVSNNSTFNGLLNKGGGIYAAGKTTIANSTVRGNRGANGGGIYNRGEMTVGGSTISDNSTAGGPGGGIYGDGYTTINSSTITGNFTPDGASGSQSGGSSGVGGGIANDSNMTLTDCTVSGNRTGRGGAAQNIGGVGGSGGAGGGILNTASMTIINSTINNNVTGDGASTPFGFSGTAGSGGRGGGIATHAGFPGRLLTITNSTISGNITGRGGRSGGVTAGAGNGGDGGGISNASGSEALKLSNSTVVLNEVGVAGDDSGRDGRGGGIDGAAQIRSTIVAYSNARPGPGRDLFGNFVSFGYNFIGRGNGACCFNNTDQVGTDSLPLAPLIGPLAANGGSGHTLTHALLPGSEAIDKGLAQDIDGQPVTTDQRFVTRPADDPSIPPAPGGDNSDIGAFERRSTDSVSPSLLTTVQFGAVTSLPTEGCVQTQVTLTRAGPKNGTTQATYAVTDQTASQRGDFTYSTGRVTFAPGEDTKTVPVLISEDAYAEGPEDLLVVLTSVKGGNIGAPNRITVQIDDDDTTDGDTNPIDDDAVFVGQHYHDFLNRHADSEGQAFWTSQLASCGGDTACRDAKRENVSAAFFLSVEFQQTGYFVIRVNKAAFGDRPGNPRYLPFLEETQAVASGAVVGQPGFDALLESNRRRYAEEFVVRPEFKAAHDGQSAEQYADSLFANTGATPTQEERDAAVSAFGSGDTAGRAAGLRSVVESESVYNKLYNPAFVLMQYFGYLRRNPDNLPDNNFDGYNFWLDKLNSFSRPGENVADERVALSRVRRAEMIKVFIISGEYRGRFQGEPNRGAQFGPVAMLWGGGHAVARSSPQ